MSPEVAQSGGSGISAFAPLSGVKQTSDERVENDAIDRTRTFDAHIHCTMCYLRLRRRLSLLLFAAIRGINVMSQSLKVGDLVKKRTGYAYPGVIVSVFTTQAGAVRY